MAYRTLPLCAALLVLAGVAAPAELQDCCIQVGEVEKLETINQQTVVDVIIPQLQACLDKVLQGSPDALAIKKGAGHEWHEVKRKGNSSKDL